MQRVLVPFDDSALSHEALEFALERFPETEVTVFFVVDTSVTFQPEKVVGVKLSDIYEQREAEGREMLEEAETIAESFDTTVETAISHGRPWQEILAYVDDHDVDHVVLGSHSRDVFERFFVGSVAERVVDRSPVPVTVIR